MFSLEVADGEFSSCWALPAGSKTTILSLIAGLTPSTAECDPAARADVTYLPTTAADSGSSSKLRPVQYDRSGQYRVRPADPQNAGFRSPPTADRLLELVGLAGLGERMPWLSGGQQQRVALARPGLQAGRPAAG
jgi:ABC-type nitrate/sulfonate/bicarbonate transport system ATPase subunit